MLAHVTAPLHKKLLNLCHDMLRTFLPHVFAKINRVSYGLLSSEDCEVSGCPLAGPSQRGADMSWVAAGRARGRSQRPPLSPQARCAIHRQGVIHLSEAFVVHISVLTQAGGVPGCAVQVLGVRASGMSVLLLSLSQLPIL